MNIVGFSGSPRKNGSIYAAVTKILEGANERGAVTQMFSAAELEIKASGQEGLDERLKNINV